MRQPKLMYMVYMISQRAQRYTSTLSMFCPLLFLSQPPSHDLTPRSHSVLVKDPNLFDDPETFNPSRFLNPHEPAGNWNGKVESDFTIPFGFGRRICPGMRVALQSIFISLARCVPKDPPLNNLIVTFWGRIFWAFDVLPAVEGSRIDHTKMTHRGITREPAPFQFRVRAWHLDVERIIESESAYADLRLKEWEY
jgi:Cytochrome P450